MFRFSSFTILLPVLLCLAVCKVPQIRAQTAEKPAALPPNQAVLASDALEKINWPNAQTFDVNGQTFARALRVRVPPTQGESNAVQITINNGAPVKKGDVLLATFAARGQATAREPGAEAGAAQIMFLFEGSSEPWTKSVTRGISLPSATVWRRVAIPFVAQQDYATGAAMASLRLAFGEQTIELADLQVRDFGDAISLEKMRAIAANLSPLGALDVTINAAHTRQTMRGLGGNYTAGGREGWGTVNDHVAQYTRAHLHPVHARLGFSLKLWQPQAGGSFVTDGKNGEVLKMAGEFAARKVPMTASIWEAPAWMTTNEGDRKIIPEAQWDAAINAIAAFLERAQKQGAPIETLSFNEADWGVDIHWAPARLAAFIKRAAPEFARRGLKTKWLVGDTTSGAALVDYARPLLEDAELRPFLGPIAFHGWDALGASDATYRAIYQLAAKYHREVWCLEAGSDSSAWQLDPKVWPTWNYALDVAVVYAVTIAEARASVVDYWTYRDDYPLVDKDNQPYPVFGVLQQFNRAFGAGTRIVEANAPSADLRVLAGVKPDGTTVAMLINPIGAGQVTLRGLKPHSTVTFTLSDEKGQGVKFFEQSTVSANGAVICALPARSIMFVQTK